MKIQGIHIKSWPVIIISDSHTNLSNIKKLKELYPKSQFISLGDITFLYGKIDEPYNKNSVQYFIDEKIPVCLGNHDQHVLGVESNQNFILYLDNHNSIEAGYGLEKHQVEYLKTLPIGFKLIRPDENYYLLYHHAPKDLWGFNDKEKLTENQFKEIYKFDDKCIAVVHGHTHLNFTEEFSGIKTKRVSVGALCSSKKGDGESYLLLTENGLEYKKI